MSGEGRLLFLGSGGSTGVPVIGCDCEVCRSTDPNNVRLRPSVLVEVNGKVLLIDAGPDFREQALRHHINRIDGVAITHTHYDHIGGLEELRIFVFKDHSSIPCLLSAESKRELTTRLAYLFRPRTTADNVTVQLSFQVLDGDRGQTTFEGVPISYVSYKQGGMGVNGFRFGDLAYVTDIRDYPDTIFSDLKGVKTLIVSALRNERSHVHFTIDDALAFAEKVGADQTWFNHMGHETDHQLTNNRLPPHVQLAHDGMTCHFQL